jgi:hypothetical protein
MRLTVVVPFPDAEQRTAYWAAEESEVDLRHDLLRAARCTCAFAATDLKAHLERTISGIEVVFASKRPEKGTTIELLVLDVTSTMRRLP